MDILLCISTSRLCARVTPVPGEIAGARRVTSLSSLRIADVIVRVPGVAEAPLKTCTSANSPRTFKPVPYWRAMCAAFGKRNRMLPNLAAASPESVPSCVRETGRKARSLSSSPSLGNSPACSSAAPRGREGLSVAADTIQYQLTKILRLSGRPRAIVLYCVNFAYVLYCIVLYCCPSYH